MLIGLQRPLCSLIGLGLQDTHALAVLSKLCEANGYHFCWPKPWSCCLSNHTRGGKRKKKKSCALSRALSFCSVLSFLPESCGNVKLFYSFISLALNSDHFVLIFSSYCRSFLNGFSCFCGFKDLNPGERSSELQTPIQVCWNSFRRLYFYSIV